MIHTKNSLGHLNYQCWHKEHETMTNIHHMQSTVPLLQFPLQITDYKFHSDTQSLLRSPLPSLDESISGLTTLSDSKALSWKLVHPSSVCFGTKSGELGETSLRDEAGEVVRSGETGEDTKSGVLTGVTDLLNESTYTGLLVFPAAVRWLVPLT